MRQRAEDEAVLTWGRSEYERAWAKGYAKAFDVLVRMMERASQEAKGET